MAGRLPCVPKVGPALVEAPSRAPVEQRCCRDLPLLADGPGIVHDLVEHDSLVEVENVTGAKAGCAGGRPLASLIEPLQVVTHRTCVGELHPAGPENEELVVRCWLEAKRRRTDGEMSASAQETRR